MELTERVLVVTGGGNGIGREVVLALLGRGARVAAVDLHAAHLAQTSTRAAAGARLTTHVVDIADRDAVLALPEEVVAAHGAVDGVVNVAGVIQKFVPVTELSFEEIERVMAVNFWGTVNINKAFLPALLERPCASLVNVSSMGALVPVPGQSAYGASKAAVKLFTEGLYAELQGTGVAVTEIFPGAIATDIAANSGVDMSTMDPDKAGAGITMTPADEAARQIVVAIEKGSFRVTIGRDAAMLDRLGRIAPTRAIGMIAKKMKDIVG